MPNAIVYKSKSGDQYSVTAPDGTEGDSFDYGEAALVRDQDGDIFFCEMDGPDDEVKVERVMDTEAVPSDVVEIEFEPGDELPATGDSAAS